MDANGEAIGTVVSDEDTPTFELVRVKLKTDKDVRPSTLVRIPVSRNGQASTLIGRVRNAHEHNPNERPEDINVRDTLQIPRNHPLEEDSTTIFRLAEVELIEEITDKAISAPQSLPNAGSPAFLAKVDEIIQVLGLETKEEDGLHIGETVSGTPAAVTLRRQAIQRHMFICGTTGSGKSYAMGVIAEELVNHNLPVVFIDTQDEYSTLVTKLGGTVKEPGKDFNIRISSLTDRELIDLIPYPSDLHASIISASFLELQDELRSGRRDKFLLSDLLDKINIIGPTLTNRRESIDLAYRRTEFLKRVEIFGEGISRADWRKMMYPCLSIKCKRLTSHRLQTVATAVLRELQDLRLRGHIPPYVAVIDEAHLFVPEGEGSACKQIIREGVRIGRHHGIAMVLLTQSPVDIDKRAIRQCNTRLVFALEPDQLDAIRGVKADASDEMLQALPKLQQGVCLLSGTYESVKHTILVDIRERREKDSEGGETPDIFKEMECKWKRKIDDLKKGGQNRVQQR